MEKIYHGGRSGGKAKDCFYNLVVELAESIIKFNTPKYPPPHKQKPWKRKRFF